MAEFYKNVQPFMIVFLVYFGLGTLGLVVFGKNHIYSDFLVIQLYSLFDFFSLAILLFWASQKTAGIQVSNFKILGAAVAKLFFLTKLIFFLMLKKFDSGLPVVLGLGTLITTPLFGGLLWARAEARRDGK